MSIIWNNIRDNLDEAQRVIFDTLTRRVQADEPFDPAGLDVETAKARIEAFRPYAIDDDMMGVINQALSYFSQEPRPDEALAQMIEGKGVTADDMLQMPASVFKIKALFQSSDHAVLKAYIDSLSDDELWEVYAGQLYDTVMSVSFAYRLTQKHVEAALAHLDTTQGRSVLDIGAGTGLVAEQLAGRDYHVVVVESNDSMMKQLRRRLADQSHVEFHHQLFEAVSLGRRRFHVINLRNVLYLVRNPSSFLDKIFRHLRPGGIVLISSPLPNAGDQLNLLASIVEEELGGVEENRWKLVTAKLISSRILQSHSLKPLDQVVALLRESGFEVGETDIDQSQYEGTYYFILAKRPTEINQPHTTNIFRDVLAPLGRVMQGKLKEAIGNYDTTDTLLILVHALADGELLSVQEGAFGHAVLTGILKLPIEKLDDTRKIQAVLTSLKEQVEGVSDPGNVARTEPPNVADIRVGLIKKVIQHLKEAMAIDYPSLQNDLNRFQFFWIKGFPSLSLEEIEEEVVIVRRLKQALSESSQLRRFLHGTEVHLLLRRAACRRMEDQKIGPRIEGWISQKQAPRLNTQLTRHFAWEIAERLGWKTENYYARAHIGAVYEPYIGVNADKSETFVRFLFVDIGPSEFLKPDFIVSVLMPLLRAYPQLERVEVFLKSGEDESALKHVWVRTNPGVYSEVLTQERIAQRLVPNKRTSNRSSDQRTTLVQATTIDPIGGDSGEPKASADPSTELTASHNARVWAEAQEPNGIRFSDFDDGAALQVQPDIAENETFPPWVSLNEEAKIAADKTAANTPLSPHERMSRMAGQYRVLRTTTTRNGVNVLRVIGR